MLEVTNSSKSKLLNIVLLYTNEEEVIEYGKKLSVQSISSNISLVIVINKLVNMSEENFKDCFKEMGIKTYFYNPGQNLGYLNGLIYGYNQYVKKHESPEWIIMSNTDISFSTDYFFEKFCNNNYNKDIWLIGPSVYSFENKSYDNPQYKKRHTLKSLNKRILIFKKPILAYYYLKIANIKAKLNKKEKQESQYSYSVHGSFFFVNVKFMEVLKNKVYGPLMYSEEAYLAELVRLNKKKCYYDSGIEVIHTGSTVTGKLEIKKRAKYIQESLEYIKKEFYIL